MGQTISLHFTPNQQDYAAVLKLFFWQRMGTKISLAVLAIAFCLVLYVIVTQGSPPTIFEILWLLLPPLFVIYILFVQPSRMAKQAVQNEQLTAEATWEISDNGVQISNRFGSKLMEWSTLKRLVTTRDYYLLLGKINHNAFRFLPRRAFTSPQEQQDFLGLVAKNLPKG